MTTDIEAHIRAAAHELHLTDAQREEQWQEFQRSLTPNKCPDCDGELIAGRGVLECVGCEYRIFDEPDRVRFE